MAELVLRRTEEALPEFEEMIHTGIFSAEEVKALVKKCTSYEYKLVRRVKVKEDFLACIQHKIHLLALIKKRRKKIGYFSKNDEIEYAIVGRIHKLFKQSTFRWPDDLQLWLSHVDFCKQWNKKIQLSKIWTGMLQLHGNTNTSLWVMAAKWELEDNRSVVNARQIFLRGIRHFPESSKLWQEYFRMELIHVMKTRQRLALLKEGEEHEQELSEEYLNGKAAQIIYENAMKAIPNDCKAKCGFLDIAIVFSFFAGELINTIVEDILENDSQDPYARSTLAKLHLNPNVINLGENDSSVTRAADIWSAEKKCWKDFESAIEELDTVEMWQEYVFFLSERATKFSSTKDKLSLDSASSDTYTEQRMEKLLSVLSKGHEAKKLSQECYVKYIDHLVSRGQKKAAVQILKDCFKFMNCSGPQVKMLELLISEGPPLKSQSKLFRDTIHDVITCISDLNRDQENSFWMTWIKYADKTKDMGYAWDALKAAKKLKANCLTDMVVYMLEWELRVEGLESAFDLYKERLQPLCPASYKLLCAMVNILRERSGENKTGVIACYEKSIDDFGKSHPPFWLEYISYLLEFEPSKVGSVHWKAMKTLAPELVQEFSEGYVRLHTKN